MHAGYLESLRLAAVTRVLAERFKTPPYRQRFRAIQLIAVLDKWYGPQGTIDFLSGERPMRIEFQRARWRIAKNRTKEEKQAEVIGHEGGMYGRQLIVIRTAKKR